MIRIYTDGACSNNGYRTSKAGYGLVAINENENILMQMSCPVPKNLEQTNNVAELLSILTALEWIEKNNDGSLPVQIMSDSAYCINGINDWRHNWALNNWKRAGNKLVKNVEIWQRIDELINESKCKLEFVKVTGHSDDYWNNVADKLAVEGRNKDDKMEI